MGRLLLIAGTPGNETDGERVIGPGAQSKAQVGRPLGDVAERSQGPVSCVYRRRSGNFWSVAGDMPRQAVLHERTFNGGSAET